VETLGGAANTLRRGPFPSPARIAAVAAVIGSSIIALALLARHGAESARAPQIAAPLPRLSYSVPPLPPPPPPVPPELVAVPAGRYYIGCHHRLDRRCWDDEKPGRLVEIGAFSLMRREVSASEYAACVAASACPQREDKAGCTAQDDTSGRPANCVTWPAAASYCRFRGWRLPTELEWEAAARGSEHPDYPWGNEPPSCERTVIADARADGCGSGAPLPVLARKADVSWVGAHDMGGSLREWTATEYGPYPNGKADPAALGKKVTRGGSWIMRPGEVATSHTRGSENSGAARTDLGFRCAK
jgi:formylglycine-generating enzyme required for sulfatase activity